MHAVVGGELGRLSDIDPKTWTDSDVAVLVELVVGGGKRSTLGDELKAWEMLKSEIARTTEGQRLSIFLDAEEEIAQEIAEIFDES